MNTYKIIIKSNHPMGIDFVKNIANYAAKGAVICEEHPIRNQFPHYLVMQIETEEKLESDIKKGVIIAPVLVPFSKEELEAMDWEDFKLAVKKLGVKGRDRTVMMNQYLKAAGIAEEEEILSLEKV